MKTPNKYTAQTPCPVRHLAIIMDGNGRWAQGRGLKRSDGHRAGTLVAMDMVKACLELGVAHLTLYAFSKENWKRPSAEVTFIFDLLVNFINKELPALNEQEVRLCVLGDMEKIPFLARKTLEHAVEKTATHSKMTLNLALNYSGRDEIIMAVKKYAEAGNKLTQLDEKGLQEFLYTKGQPDPDLVIRTSGEIRTSNFLVFQAAYSEYYFTPTLWPDFTVEELHKSIDWFCTRQRRFGDICADDAE